MPVKDRRDLKLRCKTDKRGAESFVVRAEFDITERKSASDGTGGIFWKGYASVFNTRDSYNDIILPGAYKKHNKHKWPKMDKKTGEIDSDIPSLWQHNPDWPFGLTTYAEEDEKGLYQESWAPYNDTNNERADYMVHRIVKGESVGFITLDFEEEEEEDDSFWPLRKIKAIDWWEHSPVTFPAHSDALTEMVKRNRELALTVKNADFATILETADVMKGITRPAVEEAIAVLSTVMTQIKNVEEHEEEGEEEVEEAVEETPIDEGETSEEDPELVKELEAFAFRSHAKAFAEKTRLFTMKAGGK